MDEFTVCIIADDDTCGQPDIVLDNVTYADKVQ